MNKLHAKVHKHLKLQHHRHTGRVLHHKHTSYRAIAVVLVLAGMVMVATSLAQRAAADSLFGVYAVVPQPVPTVGAIINTPSNGAILSSKSTLVAGGCPIASPQVVVSLTVDGAAAGSAICNADNNFSLPLILTAGAHSLVAQAYTTTYGQAPDGEPVVITYQPAAATTPVSRPVITSAAPFTVLGFDRTASWNGHISGGTAPYSILVDWGDGTTKAYTDVSHPPSHHYGTLAAHNIRIAVRDAAGASSQLQYAFASYEARAQPAAAAAGSSLPNGPMVAGLYGMFLTVLSVSCIIWLETKHAARQEAMATA